MAYVHVRPFSLYSTWNRHNTECGYSDNLHVVLLSGHIPNEWETGVIKPIYKIKVTLMIRVTTLLSWLGKLFTSVIKERLIDSKQIISEAQAGYRKGYSTTDQIFTLNCIVDLILSQGRRLFCIFVDYSKVFDLIRVILNMYKSIK